MGNFHPLEVVCRGSDTQIQVGENYPYWFWYSKLHFFIEQITLLQVGECDEKVNI